MKTRCIIIVALAFLMGMGVQVLEAETRDINLKFLLDDFSVEKTVNGLTEIHTNKSGYYFAENGDPGLPMKPLTIAVPDGQKVGNITVSGRTGLAKTGVIMAPNPIPLPTDGSVSYHEWERM